MNNKELTELKKIEEIKEEFIKEFVNNHNPDGWRWLRGIYIEDIWDFFLPHLKSNDEIKREAVEEFLKSQIEYEAEEYAVCPLCKRELIWGETYCPDDRRKLITETRNKLEWSNRNTVIKELIESLTQKENNE